MGSQQKIRPLNGHFVVQMDLMNGQLAENTPTEWVFCGSNGPNEWASNSNAPLEWAYQMDLINGQASEKAPIERASSRKCYKNIYVVQVDLLVIEVTKITH